MKRLLSVVAAVSIGATGLLGLGPSAMAAEHTRAPRACARALADAEKIMDLDNQAAKFVSAFFGTLKDASTGANTPATFVATLTAAADDLTAHVNDLAPQKQALQAKYLADSAKCKR